ncbi:MAG: hypothetical protein EHM72_20575, partial [Calditrichaeota bacterium]
MKIKTLFIPAIIAALALSCAGTFTDSEYFSRLDAFISAGDYAQALVNIEEAKEKQKFAYKDRLLYYLDKGVLLSYQGDYEQSNQCLNDAETAMEELFTKSISSAAASFLLNDNILPYYGETYENIYVNIFKALNYLNLNKLDDAYVEVRRVNVKLVELEDKNKRLVESLNSAQDASIPFKMQAGNFYDDALAHYLSYLIFRAQGEPDNCRISLQKLQKAWDANGEIYNFSMPSVLKKELQAFEAGRGGDPQAMKNGRLALIAFVGNAPRKKAIGGLITTYDNAIGISELDVPIALPNI